MMQFAFDEVWKRSVIEACDALHQSTELGHAKVATPKANNEPVVVIYASIVIERMRWIFGRNCD